MTSRINNIKDNKLILRDYLGLINEIVYGIELKIEAVDDQQEKQELDNKIDQLKSYKIIIKEYMNLNYTNHFDDNDLYIIYEDALVYVSNEVKSCYPSIFNENIYHDLIKNLKEISNKLLNETFINNEVYDYIIDYVNNYNSFDTWKILFFKCVYILYDNINKILNGNLFYYTTIEHFNNCTNFHQLPIEEWNFQGNNNEYVEYLELLYSYYDSEYKISSEESDDNDDDEEV